MLGWFTSTGNNQDTEDIEHSTCSSADAHSSQMPRDEQLFCGFCRTLMVSERDPRLLGCGHSFCWPCVEQMPLFGQSLKHQNRYENPVENAAVVRLRQSSMRRSSAVSLLSRFLGGSTVKDTTTSTEDELQVDTVIEERAENWYVKCLVCAGKHSLDHEGKNSIPHAELLAGLANALCRKMTTCAECQAAQTDIFCKACSMYLCRPCSKRIHQGYQTSKHQLHDMGEMRPEDMVYRQRTCRMHETEEASLYCSTCRTLACVKCAYQAHASHQVGLLAFQSSSMKDALKAKMIELTTATNRVTAAQQHCQQELGNLEENTAGAKAFVKKRIDDLIKSLRDSERHLLDEIDQDSVGRRSLLETQLAGLISYARDLKLRSQVCINVISNTHEYDIVRGADDLLPVLNKTIEGMPRLNPSASSNIHVHFDETCDLIIQLGTRLRQEHFPRPVTPRKNAAVSLEQQKEDAVAKEIVVELSPEHVVPFYAASTKDEQSEIPDDESTRAGTPLLNGSLSARKKRTAVESKESSARDSPRLRKTKQRRVTKKTTTHSRNDLSDDTAQSVHGDSDADFQHPPPSNSIPSVSSVASLKQSKQQQKENLKPKPRTIASTSGGSGLISQSQPVVSSSKRVEAIEIGDSDDDDLVLNTGYRPKNSTSLTAKESTSGGKYMSQAMRSLMN